MTRTSSSFVLGMTLLTVGMAFGQLPGPDPVRVTLDLPAEEVRAGGVFDVGVVFNVERGYHIYHPSEKQGLPTTVTLEVPAGWTAGAPVFPPAKEVDAPALGGTLKLYEGRVGVKVPVTVPADAAAGPAAVTAVAGWQACTDDACLIPKKGFKVRGEVRVALSPHGAEAVGGSTATETASPVGASEGASVGAAAETTDTPGPPNRFAEALGRGRLLALLIAFWAGLLADASGCVFPLIPLTLAFFANQADKRRGAVVALAVTYTLGMTATYATIGVIAGLAARDLGSFFNHPAGQIAVASIFGALALSFFGLYEIRLPSAVADRFGGQQKRGLPGAFFMGMTLGFVATPCVGPFAAAILAYVATTGDAWLGFFALAAFGFGMGLPFMILGMFSTDVVRRMLRAGEWLDHVKRFCGFLMLAMALFFLRARLPEDLLSALYGGLAVFWAVSFGALTPLPLSATWWARIGRAAMTLLLIFGAALVFRAVQVGMGWESASAPPGGGAPAAVEAAWETDFETGLARAKAGGKPVLVDFWSDTCIPCMELKKNEFRDPRFTEEAKRFVLVAVDVSDTEGPQFDLKIKRFKSYALPFIVFIDGQGNERRELFFEEKPSLEGLLENMRKVR